MRMRPSAIAARGSSWAWFGLGVVGVLAIRSAALRPDGSWFIAGLFAGLTWALGWWAHRRTGSPSLSTETPTGSQGIQDLCARAH